MDLPQEKLYTIYDIEALPEGQRAELIDGKIYDMGAPGLTHQLYVHFLDQSIGNYISDNKGSCMVIPAPFAVYLNNDDYNYVEPDITVVCDRDKLDEKGCHGAPDWVVEIISPSSRKMDIGKKLFKYHSAGVREYWVVDPENGTVWVYDMINDNMQEYTVSDDIRVGIFDDLVINFSELNT